MAFERTSSGNWFHSINHPNPSSRLISNGNRHRQRSSCKLRKKKMLKFGCTFLLLLCCESNSDFCCYRKMDEDKLNFIYLYFLCLTIQQLHFILFFSMNIDIIFFSRSDWTNLLILISIEENYTMNLKLNLNIKYRCTLFVY